MDASHSIDAAAKPTPVPQSRRRWLLPILVLLALGGLLLWWYGHAGPRHAGSAPRPESGRAQAPAHVPIATVAFTATPQRLELTGTVQPEMEALIAAKVVGRVRSVLVREGDRVRRGQPLVLLDARDLDAAVDQAQANLHAAQVGQDTSRINARMEAASSAARIAAAQARVAETEAALKAARAKQDLVLAGPRRQEREQAALAVSQARSSLVLAETNLNRFATLYREGAISAQLYDQYRNQYEVAKAQYETARQSRSLTEEGSRTEEIRAAQEAVRQTESMVQEAYAGLKQAQANALQADVRRQEIQSAQAQIGQSQAALELARVTRGFAAVASPFDGVVTRRLVDPGAMAGPGAPLLKVQGGQLRLEAVAPESILPRVHKGAPVPITLDALQGRQWTGHVAEIAPQGDPASHTFLVKVALPPESGASAGMFGRTRFVTGQEKRLLVPTTAVWQREGLSYVYVVDSERRARLRMITVGDAAGKQIPVLSGLSPGQEIILAGHEQITDGQPVTAERR